MLYNKSMSISVKKIGGRRYAYTAYRNGKKVIQRYMGPINAPDVIAQMAEIERAKSVPSRLFRFFWDVDPKTLNVSRHSRFIIERILDVGDLDAFWWAQKQYPTALLIEVSLTSRRLSERSKQFWKIWFRGKYVS